MRLTNFTDYALRALIYLGVHRGDDQLRTISDIAGAYGISENHLTKIVHQLAKLGYVETVRGKGGGLKLARAPEYINVGDVVRGTEADLAMVECLAEGNSTCPIAPACALQSVLGRARAAFFSVLDRQTLADLLQPQSQLVTLLGGTANPR